MILGMSTASFTLLHVVLSLVGIAAGLVLVAAMLRSNAARGWTALFLASTVLTSVTGFFFPRDQVLPSHVVGVISLLVLLIAIVALYGYRLARSWRWIYVVGAFVALWLNIFVLIAQAFQKVAFLKALAPTQSEPPFVIAQVIVLVVLVVFGFRALRFFHPEAQPAAPHPA